ncbi:MAG TPA: carbohydrate kinase [Fimbriiglobus sp.]|nr:carbohydrate kinase [Fimbriiglobus sp.]
MNPIVGIGELLWDVFPDGRKVAGGAPFNFAFHCKQLGHDAVIVSRVGNDDLGRELREEVRRLGLIDDFIETDPEHPTGTVRVTVGEQGQPAYSITEDVAWDYIGWDDQLNRLARRAKAVSFGTLGSRSGPSVVATFAREVYTTRPTTPRVFDVNIRQQYFTRATIVGLLGMASWLKVNDEELALLDGLGCDLFTPSIDMIQLGMAAGVAGWQYHRIDVVCVTRGQSGCRVYRQWEVDDPDEGSSYVVDENTDESGVPARVVDTVGAGDAFTAAMVCLHLEGRPLRECARFANHYAARVCEHQGATPHIDRAEVERAAFGR